MLDFLNGFVLFVIVSDKSHLHQQKPKLNKLQNITLTEATTDYCNIVILTFIHIY